MLPRCMNSFRWSCKLILLSLILIFGISERALAQYFPIHATVQWPSPQSPYLADYSTAGRDRLIVTLLNRDQQQPLLLAKLRLQLKSGGFTAKNREEVVYPMLELNTGVPIRLTSIDLAPYLQPQNLQTTGNLRNGQLPTGYAELSVQVVDYYTARPLSDWHTARTYLDVKKPPILNLPEQDAQVALRDPLFIRFQWTPRHQGLSGTEYEFVLKELPDNGVAPQSAFAYGQEIYRTHTRSTSLSYTHLDPLLLPNRRYAWQVRALSREGVAEFGMFEHGGYSEISWFTLNNQCDAPRGLKAQPRFAKVDLSWSKVLGTTGYIVECRPKTKLNVYEWSQTEVAGDQLTLSQLKPGWTYEWRVGTRCTGNRPVFSEVREFTLSKYNETLLADCGKEPVRPDLAQDPHLGIRAGDIVTIGGDYPMSITEVSPLGDGWYAGKGKTRLKSIIDAPIALRFDRLRINVDKYQIDGTVEASYDETKAKIVNLDYIDDGGKDIKPATIRMREHKMNFTLPDIPQLIYNPKIGELETTDAEGNPQTIKIDVPENASYESIFPMLVTDNKGNTYQISPSERNSEGTGNDVENKNKGEKIELNCERVDRVGDFNTESLSSKYGYIHFKRGEGKYAFDEGQEKWYKKSVKVDRFYKPFSKDYIAPWKLVPVGENDIVMAKYDGLKNIDLKKVRFVSEPNSTALPARLNEAEQTWTITLRSVSAGASYDIFAVYEGVVIGKLCVVSYSKQKHKLTLVPINDTKLDKTHIERELNAVYAPIGINFNVEVDERMRGNYSWEVPGEQDKLLSLVGKSFWGYDKELKESTEMLNLQKTYQQAAGTLDGVYLFVLNGATGLEGQKGDLLGEMPRKSRFGYIFAGNSPNTEEIIHTIAHELGHGIFTLQHTFDAEYGKGTQGKTNNLLDYPSNPLDYKEKTELAAFQWNIISNPAVFTVADNKSQGDLVRREQASVSTYNGGITPDGKVILTVKAMSSNHIAILNIISGSYYVHGITLFSRDGELLKSYSWDKEKKTYVSGNVLIEDALDLKITYSPIYQKVTTRLYRIDLGEKCFYQYHDVTYDPANPSSLKIPERGWVTDYLWSASESCKSEFIARTILAKDRRSYDEGEIERDILKLGQLSEKTSYEDLLRTLESCHIRSLKRQSYEWLIRTFKQIARKETLKEREELAILRLMQSMDGKDYSRFYRDLEADQNALLRHLVAEIDDVSPYFWIDKNNYTNFIGALVWMFNADGGKSIKERFPQAPDDYARIVLNLTSVKYSSVKLMGGGDASLTEKYNQGEYMSSTGEIRLWDVYKTKIATRNSFISQEAKDSLGVVSPLTPIIIVPDTDNLSLIETALGGNALSDQLYVVPAIFLKYYADKIRNDNIAKGVVTVFDVATIVFSGGTALATKVHWIRRAWALAEVVGAVGNIAVNAQVITNPELKLAVDIYNTAMGVIGLKNAGQTGYKFVKNLPKQSKTWLQENKALRSLLASKYSDWKRIVSQKIDGLSPSEKQLLSQQEEVFKTLTSFNPERKPIKIVAGGEAVDPSIKAVSKTELTKFITSQVYQLLGKLKGTKAISPNKEAKLRKILSDFSPEVLDKLLHTEGVEIVLRDMAQNEKKLQGGKFQLQYFVDHFAEGTSIVKFEVKEEIKVGEKTVARVYDIVADEGRSKIHYELKNWSGWQSWSSKAFRDQFLKDLAAMAKGKRVKWVFSGHKMSREEVKRKIVEALQDPMFQKAINDVIDDEKVPVIGDILGVKIKRKAEIIKNLEQDKVFDIIFEITR